MKLYTQIAKRYVFAKKPNLVNIISFISIFGIMGMTAALLVVLSVFNGFDKIIMSFISDFDADLKIESKISKSFVFSEDTQQKIKTLEGVNYSIRSIEESALFQYQNKEKVAKIKAVDTSFTLGSNIKNRTIVGNAILQENNNNFCIVGSSIANNLYLDINYSNYLKIWLPIENNQEEITLANAESAFNKINIMPSGIFDIHHDYDAKYVIAPYDFIRREMNMEENSMTSLEIFTKANTDLIKLKESISQIIGNDFTIKNRLEQQELLYKVMKSEKFAIFILMSLILVIASFNIIGAITMLIIDKKHDISTLKSLGANQIFIKDIFKSCGKLITLVGSLLGIIVGSILCVVQEYFHVIKFPKDGVYIIDYYPVDFHGLDIILVFVTVTIIGFCATWLACKKI